MADLKRVSPDEANRLVGEEGYQYVDVRTEEEFAAGHPSGAHNVPFLLAGAGGMTPNPEFLTVFTKAYAKSARIVLGCKSGGRSQKAGLALLGAGYEAIIDQRAGFDGARNAFGQVVEKGWREQGLPSEAVTPGGSYREIKERSA